MQRSEAQRSFRSGPTVMWSCAQRSTHTCVQRDSLEMQFSHKIEPVLVKDFYTVMEGINAITASGNMTALKIQNQSFLIPREVVDIIAKSLSSSSDDLWGMVVGFTPSCFSQPSQQQIDHTIQTYATLRLADPRFPALSYYGQWLPIRHSTALLYHMSAGRLLDLTLDLTPGLAPFLWVLDANGVGGYFLPHSMQVLRDGAFSYADTNNEW